MLTGGRPRGAPIALSPRLVAGAAIVEVAGKVDRSTAPALRDELRRVASSGNGTVVVDLRRTRLIDSTGLSALLNAQRRLTRQGRTLRVVSPDGPVRKALAVTRLMETLGVCETLTAALDHAGQVRAATRGPDVGTPRPGTRVRREQLYADALEVIERRHPEPLDVDDVAQAVFASRRQLQRVFAEVGGTTIRHVIASTRLERAAELLREGRIPIKDVGAAVGLAQAAQFTKAFRHHFGVSPSEYRRRYSA